MATDHAPVDHRGGPSEPYWAAARQGRLVLQRCAACATVRHYPQPLCPRCYSFDVEHFEASGRGAVHSWTETHHPFEPSVADQVPYVLVTVDLAEGVRVLGRMTPGDRPRLGMPVTIRFRSTPGEEPRLEVSADPGAGG